MSSDGMQVYVTGYDDNAVATFTRFELVDLFADGFESGDTSGWSTTAGVP